MRTSSNQAVAENELLNAIQFASEERIDWLKSVPFILVHIVSLAIFWTGITWINIGVCLALYYIRMFFITAGYHRYFAHRSYKLNRVMQFLMAVGGSSAGQKGVFWWASHHRHHHRFSDQIEDVHSPIRGFWWSHLGWILCERYHTPHLDLIKDLTKFPELRWIDKYWYTSTVLLAVICFALGGWSTLIVGYFLSTVLLYHGTFLVNSATHVFGRRRFITDDTSRNSMIIALLTCGEGWHNNHHHYQSTANQGFYWWEIDLSYYVLKIMSWLGLASDLRVPPKNVLANDLLTSGQPDIGMDRVAKLMALIHQDRKPTAQGSKEETSTNPPLNGSESPSTLTDEEMIPVTNNGYREGSALECVEK
ncbi:MAG: acyl-CoA desaturase [Nitrospira sp.]|nr:acyl-CoA desaturase [Candidatus Manganitrophaceae bacterium]HIL33893.1 acyl-CoA desaturase [Candidatus Manganitrophaceae bacterium]